ncbi:MAG: hypothetical protein LUD77_04380, partial [Clostridiales bacterium]|nr:hypothetical protein [Clostridiales bacterium]
YTGDEVCTVCGETISTGQVIPTTDHSYDSGVVTKEATCTEDGEIIYTCTVCGSTKTEAIPSTGHSYDSCIVTIEATCTEDGEMTYTCTVCGDTVTEAIPATGHTEVIDSRVEPTCTETGLTEGSHCSVCGTVITKQEEIPATGHSYDEGSVTTEPTCTAEGVMTYTCTACGDTYTESIEAKGHTEEIDEAVEATCTENGLIEGSHCSECG